ncbi:ABC-2 type transport system permease protein [Homoserinimonas aerilata]|uniref:ABC-2 type transport system permease protein n=1 Tax=Homoserinimonas aerilata TaxID=1162970 RepID=A0A542YF67_9MICO|nr:ABC transporter permease [Homoserinimonas aerilata]TQL46738.1 ABC-2 type transport system permease protein [Homoserinimonas aerilata]
MTTPRNTDYETPGFLSATWLVAEREMRMRLRSKSFLISTGILLLIVLASVVIGGFTSQNVSLAKVAAVGSAIEVAESSGAFEVTEAADVAAAEKLVRSGDVEAAIVPSDDPTAPLGVSVIALEDAPGSVLSMLSVTPDVQLLEPVDLGQNPFLIYLVAIGFGLIYFMSAITFGQTIAQSVVEEKQTRIVEILMATVPVRALLAGKILGNSILAFAQIALIAALAGVGMLASGQDILFADLGLSLVWFVVLFLFGFILLAALYSATAALVSRQEDMATATAPVTYLVMIPYILVIMFNDNPLVLGIMSYVPFSAPVGMPMRVFLGTAEWWEPVLSLAILLVTTALVIALGSRIYSNALLRMGARVKLKEALRG